MGVSVARSFETEVAKAFRFLVSEYGLSGPVTGPGRVEYFALGVTYEIVLDPVARAVTTHVGKELGAVRFDADLPALVVGAALGLPEHVRRGAHSLTELRATVLSQAAYVRRLQPYLTPLNVLPLMRAAYAQETPLTVEAS